MEQLRPPVDRQPMDLQHSVTPVIRTAGNTTTIPLARITMILIHYEQPGDTYSGQTLIVADVDISIKFQKFAHTLLLAEERVEGRVSLIA